MEELKESELGTRAYWDKRYDEEIENYNNYGDPGEIWFGENVVKKIIKWILKNTQPHCKLIDIGCGNGMFLTELAKNGYTNLYGIDYSEAAITLSQSIAKKKNLNIFFSTCNILENLEGNYDVIHDKGTYDAICLSSNAKENRNKYLCNISKSLNADGFFLITSCNWTKTELDNHFETHFVCLETIQTTQFTFGGKTGNNVTCLIYKKKKC